MTGADIAEPGLASLQWRQPPRSGGAVSRAERAAANAAAEALRRDARRALLIAFGEKISQGKNGGTNGRSPEALALRVLAALSPRDATLARELAIDTGVPLDDMESIVSQQQPFSRANSVNEAIQNAAEAAEEEEEGSIVMAKATSSMASVVGIGSRKTVGLFSAADTTTTIATSRRIGGIAVSQPPGGISTAGSIIAGDFGGILDGGENRAVRVRGRRSSSVDVPRAAGRSITHHWQSDGLKIHRTSAPPPSSRLQSSLHEQLFLPPEPVVPHLTVVASSSQIISPQPNLEATTTTTSNFLDDSKKLSFLFSDTVPLQIFSDTTTTTNNNNNNNNNDESALSQTAALNMSVSTPLIQAAARVHAVSLSAVILIGDVLGHITALRGWALLGEGHVAAAAVDAIAAAAAAAEMRVPFHGTSTAVVKAQAAWAGAAADYGLAAATEACARGARARTSSNDTAAAATPVAREAASLAALAARAAEGTTPSIAHFSRFGYTERSSSVTNQGSINPLRPPLVELLDCLEFTWAMGDAPLAARVISRASLARYASVHRFLLRVRAASVRLRNSRGALVGASRILRPRGVRGWSATGREDAAFLGSRAIPVALFIFRHEAAHVINALDGYVTTAVVSGAWRDFILSVEAVAARGGSVSALRQAHDAYTIALEQRCFLTPSTPSLEKSTTVIGSSGNTTNNNEWRLLEELEMPLMAPSVTKTNTGLALSGSGGVGASRLLDTILDAAVSFADVVDTSLDTWTARGANPDTAPPFDTAALELAARIAKVFKGTSRALRAGLDAVTAAGGGFAAHISDLQQRLGPA